MLSKNSILILAAIVLLGGVLFYSLRGKPAKAPQFSLALDVNAPHLAWKFKNDRTFFANLTLGSDGTIYGSSNQGIIAVSPDGNLKWHAQYGSLSYTAMGSDGILYAAEMHGLIFGVSPDGTVSWKPGYGLIGFHAPPAIGGRSTVLFANTTADLYAFEQGSATAAWSQNTFREGAVGDNYGLPGSARVGANNASSPVVYSDDSIALPRQRWLQMFSADGTPTWNLELTPGNLGIASLGEDGTVYVADDRSMLYAVDHSGAMSWEFEADDVVAGSPVVDADGVLYFTTARSVYALDRTGAVKWQVTPKHTGNSTPTLAADGSIYISAADGLFALNPDGTEKWSVQAPGGGTPPSISADGTVYFVCAMWICAVEGIHSPLMKSPWPRIYHDSGNTGNVLTQF
ncbi:MAG TPA: PQQ-binding-like beta-propeller repeat protein [Candidatus Acidoferrales bacterium]|nr:PQQ-binding-like beta-propeller repeat protein [Candidatus Acidoferrales bacterium]